MSDAVNVTGLNGQHAELLPARVVMSVYVCGTGILGHGSGSEAGGVGGAGGHAGDGSSTVVAFVFGSGNSGTGGAVAPAALARAASLPQLPYCDLRQRGRALPPLGAFIVSQLV